VNVRNGNQLKQWVERWNTPLKRFFARRLPQHIDAEDLAQEVYLRLLRIKDLDSIEAPQAYLYHVARNIAAECYARSRGKLHSHEELDALIEFATPETLAAESIEERSFDEALRCLPPAARAAIYLKLRDGKTHEEIGIHLGISTRMVRKLLTAGYAGLRRHLIRE
jgi:RNA polymerase sigma-70 factor (ECF subfamily)